MAIPNGNGNTVKPSSRVSSTSQMTETTPLIISKGVPVKRRLFSKPSVVSRLLFTSFVVAVSFSVTQIPLIYVFGLMTCEEHYKTHLDHVTIPDRCRIPEIEASTARSIALLGAGTTLFGVANLFFTSWSIKRFGVKTALLTSILWPAVRLAIQNVGVQTGGATGIIIIQCSQIITVFGGPAGYLLSLNSFATDVVEASNRTLVLGRLQGVAFFGTSLGFVSGGLMQDKFGRIAPFRVTLALFSLSTIYVFFSLPRLANNISPEQLEKTASLAAFFEPLLMFVPRRCVLIDGSIRRQYGVLLLGVGAFLALLATGYIPTLLQLFATDDLSFSATENGLLVSLNSLIRGIFLTFAFPVIISSGRSYLDRKHSLQDAARDDSQYTDSQPPLQPTDFEPGPNEGESTEGPLAPVLSNTSGKATSFQFDLLYTRYSILVDGILTSLATFTSKPWHLYVVTIVLPLAAGTGSAAKGTIMAMCEPEERVDALSAISLVEMSARLASTGVFGVVFAAFAAVERSNLTFLANGAVAVLAFLVLLVTRFPPPGARRIRDEELERHEE